MGLSSWAFSFCFFFWKIKYWYGNQKLIVKCGDMLGISNVIFSNHMTWMIIDFSSKNIIYWTPILSAIALLIQLSLSAVYYLNYVILKKEDVTQSASNMSYLSWMESAIYYFPPASHRSWLEWMVKWSMINSPLLMNFFYKRVHLKIIQQPEILTPLHKTFTYLGIAQMAFLLACPLEAGKNYSFGSAYSQLKKDLSFCFSTFYSIVTTYKCKIS